MTSEDNIDIEAIQAQIDLSNSVTHNLVSSWMKSSTSQAPSLVSQQISRELEEFAKRPSRLGLGATLSKSDVATIRGAAILKGKLTGSKRPRELEGDGTLPSTDKKNTENSEDEQDSRSTAISTKKARHSINGAFGLGNKMGNKVGAGFDLNGGRKSNIKNPDISVKTVVHGAGPSGFSKEENRFVSPEKCVSSTTVDSPSTQKPHFPSLHTPDTTSSFSVKRRKRDKKNKDKLAAVQANTTLSDEEEEWTGFGSDALADIKMESRVVIQNEPSRSPIAQEPAVTNPVSSSSKTIAPLLNLGGPISNGIDLEEDAASIQQTVNDSPRKKRRRRRNKAKDSRSQGDAAT